MDTDTAAPSQHNSSPAKTSDEILDCHFDHLASRRYLKADQSSHRRFHHLYEDLLM